MARFRPSELRQYLHAIGAMPKKGLSQNFLIDGNILKKIVALSGVQAGDYVLEIGPGPGALTELLLETGCHVIAIEKDEVFAKALIDGQYPYLQVICSDVLAISFAELLAKLPTKVKVVANLPYHLTTPIVYKILKASDYVESATLMVQEEVARRFVTPATSKDYGAVNVVLNYYGTTRYGFPVSNKSFYPVPRVRSAVIHLLLKKQGAVSNEERFFAMVEKAFSMRRKTLASSLRELYSPEAISTALQKQGKLLTVRPEELSLQDWIGFFTNLLNA